MSWTWRLSTISVWFYSSRISIGTTLRTPPVKWPSVSLVQLALRHRQQSKHDRTEAGGRRRWSSAISVLSWLYFVLTSTKALEGEFEDVISLIFEGEKQAKSITFTGALIRVRNALGQVRWERREVQREETKDVPSQHRCEIIKGRVKFTRSWPVAVQIFHAIGNRYRNWPRYFCWCPVLSRWGSSQSRSLRTTHVALFLISINGCSGLPCEMVRWRMIFYQVVRLGTCIESLRSTLVMCCVDINASSSRLWSCTSSWFSYALLYKWEGLANLQREDVVWLGQSNLSSSEQEALAGHEAADLSFNGPPRSFALLVTTFFNATILPFLTQNGNPQSWVWEA